MARLEQEVALEAAEQSEEPPARPMDDWMRGTEGADED